MCRKGIADSTIKIIYIAIAYDYDYLVLSNFLARSLFFFTGPAESLYYSAFFTSVRAESYIHRSTA